MDEHMPNESLILLNKRGPFSFLRNAVRKIVYPLSIPFVIRKLRLESARIGNLEDLVDFTFDFKIGRLSIAPMQVKAEILELLKILEKYRPKTILEIGTAGGGCLFLFSRIADPNATLISVDLPSGEFGGGYPKWKTPLYLSFAIYKQKLYCIRGDSHKLHTPNTVKEILGGRKLDLIFIDGDHTYSGVKKDFGTYLPLVKKGGLIVLHDIAPHTETHDPEGRVGVPRFWNEIKGEYKHYEIVKDPTQGWAGIGVIYV